MTVTGPDFLAPQVRDLARAAAFYQQHLGLRQVPVSPPGAVVFATTPIPFAVRDPLPGVDLAAAGVPVPVAPFDGPCGRTFTFTDPDGYAITVHGGA